MVLLSGRQAGGVIVLLIYVLIGTATAAPRDYMFELAQLEVKPGTARLTARLIHMPSGKAIPDAAILENNVEMVMPGGDRMPTSATPPTADGQGNYRFQAELPMAGDWLIHLAAKVRGEPETVRGTVKLKTVP